MTNSPTPQPPSLHRRQRASSPDEQSLTHPPRCHPTSQPSAVHLTTMICTDSRPVSHKEPWQALSQSTSRWVSTTSRTRDTFRVWERSTSTSARRRHEMVHSTHPTSTWSLSHQDPSQHTSTQNQHHQSSSTQALSGETISRHLPFSQHKRATLAVSGLVCINNKLPLPRHKRNRSNNNRSSNNKDRTQWVLNTKDNHLNRGQEAPISRPTLSSRRRFLSS